MQLYVKVFEQCMETRRDSAIYLEHIVTVLVEMTLVRVRNEKIDCHRFSGIASQRVEWVGPDIEQVKREAPSPSFLQEKQKYLK